MIPKSAITKAIEGGYIDFAENYSDANRICDPSFWQCLGKALGWGGNAKGGVWSQEAIRFYKIILTGGNVEQFWNELLK
jgi:hypothetical protein